MKLFWCPRTRAFRILWLMEELGLTYDLVPLDVRDPSAPRDPEFIFASPMGKVPAIADEGVMLSESAAIALYLADKYQTIKLAPDAHDVARGRFLYWMFFTPAVAEPAMLEKFSNLTPNKLAYGHGSFDEMIKTLEAGLKGGSWILPDDFSAADVMIGSSVNFLATFKILPDSDILKDYLTRCMARDAFKRAVAIEEKAQG